MKSLMLVCALLFVGLANATPTPYPSAAIYNELKKLFDVSPLGTKKVFRAPWTISSTVPAGSTVNLGVTLPPKALVTFNYIHVVQQLQSSSGNTISLGCETASDLKLATNISAVATGSNIAGAATPSSIAFVKSSDGCDLTVTVGAGASGITGGELIFMGEYDVVD